MLWNSLCKGLKNSRVPFPQSWLTNHKVGAGFLEFRKTKDWIHFFLGTPKKKQVLENVGLLFRLLVGCDISVRQVQVTWRIWEGRINRTVQDMVTLNLSNCFHLYTTPCKAGSYTSQGNVERSTVKFHRSLVCFWKQKFFVSLRKTSPPVHPFWRSKPWKVTRSLNCSMPHVSPG